MDQAKLDLEIRLRAIEYVLAHVGKIALMALNNWDEAATNLAARRLRGAAQGKLGVDTYPGAAPEVSDHLAAEFQARVDALLEQLENAVVRLA